MEGKDCLEGRCRASFSSPEARRDSAGEMRAVKAGAELAVDEA